MEYVNNVIQVVKLVPNLQRNVLLVFNIDTQTIMIVFVMMECLNQMLINYVNYVIGLVWLVLILIHTAQHAQLGILDNLTLEILVNVNKDILKILLLLNCEQCLSSCLTCVLQQDNCTSCDPNYNLALVYNKCVCAKSYYFYSLTTQCEQCNIRCLECYNSNECTQCRLTTRHYNADSKNCLCNDGYYETNQQNCQLCHLSCATCQDVNNYCLTCLNESKKLFANNTCLCQDSYYDAGIEICQKCNNVCKTCQSSASTCLSCYDIEQYRYLSGNKCLCKAGYYESNTDKCSKCSNQCLTCQGLADYCTSCDINSKRINQSIIHKCPCIFGFYQDQNQTYQKCHIKCQSCVHQADQCLSCNFQQNSNRLTLSDLCNCKRGYYDDGTQLQCQLCNVKCQTCIIQEDSCQICSNQIRTNQPTCCASQCSTCIFQPSNCLSCNPGRIGQDCKCIFGYFEIGQILCSQCAFQCATCELDPLNCKTCKGDRYQEPQCICQIAYFDDQINEDCQPCDMTCIECNINGCSSCSANRILNKDMVCLPPPNSISYHNTPWCSTCEVAKAYFSDDLTKIIIHFDFPLNPKGFSSQVQVNKCLQIFEVEFVQILGQNSACYLNLDNNQELLVSLGNNSKILVGDKILFKSNTLSQINCQITLKTFIFDAIQMPINPFPPQIQHHVPLHKLNPLADNSVYLKSIKNNGIEDQNMLFGLVKLKQLMIVLLLTNIQINLTLFNNIIYQYLNLLQSKTLSIEFIKKNIQIILYQKMQN